MLYSPLVSESQVKSLSPEGDPSGSEAFLDKIKKNAESENAIFYRLELDVPRVFNFPLSTFHFVKSFEEMQPEHTLILNIDQSEEEILARMKPKGRYNIKVAERHNIEIEKSDSAAKFFELYKTMAERHKITHRNLNYFQNLVDILKQKGYVQVFNAAATIDGKKEVLASAIIGYFGDRVTYLFGGSSNLHRELMAPYKLHWEIIKDAKNKGFKEYDFFGIAPDDNPKHKWAGVTRFKKQFGGEEVSLLGSYDLVFNKTKYSLFKTAERIRRK